MNRYHHEQTYMDLVTERKRVGLEYTHACCNFMPLEVTNYLLSRYQRIDRITRKMEEDATRIYKHQLEMESSISKLVVDGEVFE